MITLSLSEVPIIIQVPLVVEGQAIPADGIERRRFYDNALHSFVE